MERYGLPKPDHSSARPTRRSPTTSSRGSPTATITPKPNIAALDAATRVRFADGTRGPGRPRRLLHRLQGHVPVLRRGLHRRARQRPAAVPAHLPPDVPDAVLHRAAAAARGDHADRRARSREWVGDYLAGALRAAAAAARCGPTSSDERRRMFKRYVASKRHTMQVDYDDYIVATAKERRRGGERARSDGSPPVPPVRGGGQGAVPVDLGADGAARRPAARRPRPPTAPRSSPPARDVFAELGYGAACVRDIVRRTELAAGHVLQLLPRQGVDLPRARGRGRCGGAAARARARTRRRRPPEASSRTAIARTSPSSSRTPGGLRVRCAATPGRSARMFDDVGGAGGHRRAGGRPAGRDRGAGACRRSTSSYCAAAMVAVGARARAAADRPRRARCGGRDALRDRPLPRRYRARRVRRCLRPAAAGPARRARERVRHVQDRDRREPAEPVRRPAVHLARHQVHARRRVLRRDDERRRRAAARDRLPDRRAGRGHRAAGDVRARARLRDRLRREEEPPQARAPFALPATTVLLDDVRGHRPPPQLAAEDAQTCCQPSMACSAR